MNHFLLCCDWGTTSLRIRYVKNKKEIVGEISSDKGVKKIFQSWKEIGEPKGITKNNFFRKELLYHIYSLEKKLSVDLKNVPIILSGMVSSSMGMEEIPYTSLPISLSGESIKTFSTEAKNDFPHEILLISGLQDGEEIMRGEETQLIGLINNMKDASVFSQDLALIFPGTHSKHVFIKNFKVISFSTFITGELFEILSQHSILQEGLQKPEFLNLANPENLNGFKKGLKASNSSNLLNILFSVRTNELFKILKKEPNFYYLSGLLIGTELQKILSSNLKIIICCEQNLFPLYQKAFEEFEYPNVSFINTSLFEKATISGQVLIYDINKKIKND